MQITISLFSTIILISFLCEYMDASIGMGYGTTLTPLLLLLGFEPLEVVSAVLLGQIVGGVTGGIAHCKIGNIKLNLKSMDLPVIAVLGAFGVLGSLIAVFFAINISQLVLKFYIGIMLLGIGLLVLWKKDLQGQFKWWKLIIIALVSAFNKGVSGGGYGPLVTSGQLLSGRESKSAVGSTTIAETIVCIVAFLSYIFLKQQVYLEFALAVSCGSILAGPLSALTVSKINEEKLKTVIGTVTCLLGAVTLLKALI